LFGDLFGLQRRRSASRPRPALHAGAGLRRGGAGVARRLVVFERPEDCTGVQRHRAPRAAARAWSPAARCGGRGRHPQEGRLPDQPARLHGLRRAPGRCRACAARPARAPGWSIASGATPVRIPPGSTGGSTQRVPREGGPGRRGGPPGDLHVIVRVRPAPVLRARVDA
jgi:molecular chaperone DnaJ